MKEIDKIISNLNLKLAKEKAMVSSMIEEMSNLNFSDYENNHGCSITRKHREFDIYLLI